MAPAEGLLAEIARALGTGPLCFLGGFENHVYRWWHDGQPCILRLTHRSHRSLAQLRAELAFVVFLQRHGAAVCQVLERAGRRVHSFGAWAASMFLEARGEPLCAEDWGDQLFVAWGQAIGSFHRLAARYQPALEARRYAWQDDPNLALAARIPRSQLAVQAQAAETLRQLRALPDDPSLCGLIHADAHSGNLRHDREGRLTFFDFDDCCYHWFAYDLATVLFYAVLQPWIGDTDEARAEAARVFLRGFCAGYTREQPLPGFVFEQLALFLKLRELSLYAAIHHALDVSDLQGWFPRKFMAGRQQRLAAGRPFLELDPRTLRLDA